MILQGRPYSQIDGSNNWNRVRGLERGIKFINTFTLFSTSETWIDGVRKVICHTSRMMVPSFLQSRCLNSLFAFKLTEAYGLNWRHIRHAGCNIEGFKRSKRRDTKKIRSTWRYACNPLPQEALYSSIFYYRIILRNAFCRCNLHAGNPVPCPMNRSGKACSHCCNDS